MFIHLYSNDKKKISAIFDNQLTNTIVWYLEADGTTAILLSKASRPFTISVVNTMILTFLMH